MKILNMDISIEDKEITDLDMIKKKSLTLAVDSCLSASGEFKSKFRN